MRIGREIDRLPVESRHPRPDGDVGDRIPVGDVFVLGEPAVEHAVEPVRFLEIALFRVRRLALVVFHEVMHLAEHRAGAAHLPHQPFEHAIMRFACFRQKLAGLVGEIDEDRAGFHQADAGVAIDDRGDAIIRADLQKFRLELLVLADVDRMHRVRQLHLLERDGGLAAVGRRPGVEIEHEVVPV